MHSANSVPPQEKNSQPEMLPPKPVPTLTSKATTSLQTVQNVTYLLNNLLHQYDNSLRPDLGGKKCE